MEIKENITYTFIDKNYKEEFKIGDLVEIHCDYSTFSQHGVITGRLYEINSDMICIDCSSKFNKIIIPLYVNNINSIIKIKEDVKYYSNIIEELLLNIKEQVNEYDFKYILSNTYGIVSNLE